MRLLLTLAIAIAAGPVASRSATYELRRHERELAAQYSAHGNVIDVGVRLSVVEADPSGKILISGKPPLRIVDEREFGGMLDLRPLRQRNPKPPELTGRSRNPLQWYCSAAQFPVILHGDDEPQGDLVYGSMRGGKTSCIAPWVYLRWIENLHHDLGERRPEGGVTAPTNTPRLLKLRKDLLRTFRPEWFTFLTSLNTFRMADGTSIQLMSTHQQSEDEGSRLQGQGWWWAASDEIQDSLDQADEILTRLSEAPDGRFKWLATATAKDTPAWRNWRDQALGAKVEDQPLWTKRTLLGTDSPFVPPKYWLQLRAGLSDREAKRRIEAVDLPLERATYPAWSRDENLIDIPDLGWQDVTADVLAPYARNATVLAGHDPGTLCDVSLFFKAFRRPLPASEIRFRRFLGIPLHDWVAIHELTTDESSTEEHGRALLQIARERWRCNLIGRDGRRVDGGPQVLVRADPAGNSDSRTDKSVYTQLRALGLLVRAAAYNEENDGHGRVPLDPSIELLNKLFANTFDPADPGVAQAFPALTEPFVVRRLFVARDAKRQPVAPKFVHALETAERDLAGKADTQRKNKRDVSHWPAAGRYALWVLERPRILYSAGGA